jgi:Transposase DNA-binding/Transposase Tn5 dimerisation domain
MQNWIEMETNDADFGDERLNARYQILLDQLSDKPSLSIPAACGGQAETAAAYRFFDNEKTDPAKVLAPHRNATLQRIRAEAVVISAQDTTEADLSRKQEKVGGPLDDGNRWGLYVHPVLVMTPHRVPLGVVDAEMWSRDPAELEKTPQERRKERRDKRFEDKESYRWLKGYETACQIAAEAPNTQVVSVSDSEGDIFECFLAGVREDAQRAEWIVRGCQDRALAEEEKSLLPLLACQAPLGTMTVQASKREATTGNGRKRQQPRESREAKVTVRAVRTLLRAPYRPDGKLSPVYVNAILVREENPPEGEAPIEWLLVTSLPIATFAEACTVVGYYCCRWEIEVFFRVLKSGCKIEELQFEREDRLQVCLAMYLIVAWRVLYVLKLGRECPEMSCAAILSEAEWKSVYVIAKRQAAPKTPPSLKVIIPLIAGMGGYLGRKHDGPPGPKTMWIGLQRMRDFATAWAAFGPAAAKSCV